MAKYQKTKKDAAAKLQQTTFWNVAVVAIALVGTIDTLNKWLSGENWKALELQGLLLLAILLSFSLIVNYFSSKSLRVAADKREKISNYLLVVPSDGEESFYLGWAFLLLKESRIADDKIYITTEFAAKSFSNDHKSDNKLDALERLEDLKRYGDRHFDGIFVILEDPDDQATRDQMLRYYELVDSNLVLLDMNMNHVVTRQRGYPIMDFVGSNEKLGGAMAGQFALDYAKAVGIEGRALKILILEPHNLEPGSPDWDHIRIEEFKRHIRDYSSFPDVEFQSIPDCGYNTSKTVEAIRVRPKSGSESVADFLLQFDLIYASNDDTAIGALRVLEEELEVDNNEVGSGFPHHGILLHKGPRIIGYDGTRELCELASKDNQWLLGTIDVKQGMQAKKALEQMIKLRRMSRPAKAMSLRTGNLTFNRMLSSKKSGHNGQGHDFAYEEDGNFRKDLNGVRYLESEVPRPDLIRPAVKISPFLRDPFITEFNKAPKSPKFRYSVITETDLKDRI